MRRTGGWSWVSAFGMLALLGMVYAYRGGGTLLFALVLVGLLITQGVGYACLGPRKIQVSRRWSPQYPQAGQPVQVEVRLTFTGGMGFMPLQIEDIWTAVSEGQGRTAVRMSGECILPDTGPKRWFSIRGRRTLTCMYSIEPESRGIYTASELKISWEDPFGWFKRSRRAVCGDRMIVHPALFSLHIELAPQQSPRLENQPAAGRLLPVPAEEFDGLRAYAPGDPLKWIHWKNSAKRGTLQVRVSRERKAENRCLLLDTASASWPGAVRKRQHLLHQAFECAVSLTASVLQAELTSREGTHSGQVWLYHQGMESRRILDNGRLTGSQGLIAGLNMLSGLSPNGGDGDSALVWLENFPEHLKGQHVTCITGRCTARLTQAALLASGKTGHLDVVLVRPQPQSGPASAEDLVQIARLRAAGIPVCEFTAGAVQSLSSVSQKLRWQDRPAEGGGGHVTA